MDSLKNIDGFSGSGKRISKQEEIENRKIKKAYQDRPVSSSSSRSDRADISETGKALLALHSEAADLVSNVDPQGLESVDSARLEKLRHEISEGTFLTEERLTILADKLLAGIIKSGDEV